MLQESCVVWELYRNFVENLDKKMICRIINNAMLKQLILQVIIGKSTQYIRPLASILLIINYCTVSGNMYVVALAETESGNQIFCLFSKKIGANNQ